METTVKNREWVKNAAIIFLSVLLVLTFFSNTIMNRSLPEVATAQVQSGNIVAKVRGSGTVTANGSHNVKATETRTIRSVMVKVGQEVNAGDVLFVLGEGDATELEQARETLRDLQYAYQKSAVSIPNYDYSSYQKSIKDAQRALEKAQDECTEAKEAYERALGTASLTSSEASAQLAAAENELRETEAALSEAERDFQQYQAQHDEADARVQAAILKVRTLIAEESNTEQPAEPIVTPAPETTPTPDPADDGEENGLNSQSETNALGAEAPSEMPSSEEPAEETPPTPAQVQEPAGDTGAETVAFSLNRGAGGILLLGSAAEVNSETSALITPQATDSAALSQARIELDGAVKEHNDLLESTEYITAFNKYNLTKDRYFRAIEKRDSMIPTAAKSYKTAYEAKQQSVEVAKSNLEYAQNSYYTAIENNEKTAAVSYIDLQQQAERIKLQQEKIKSLAGDEENVITANVSGTVETIECTAGDTVLKDKVLCSIEVPDMGHTLSFSVTNDQAQRLRIGDSATVSNYYWGNSVTATLTTIRTDPKNPQSNKVLTFDLEGDVTTGAEMTISVGQKSANYDLIVPNSAIKSDSNGSFVLAVSAKSSPLGNRYSAKRVSIEVLANDDNNSAVVADLSGGDYVITTSSAPLKSGDLVRMADNG
ncbi:MAG: HlyD family efflux transporter periplasmic adaptor subunit [Oscillospiraceae bacterium]|nr:HlyD family efflux transporter periplasmic adaptor subunit [Oscillospiraceae bacterium]